jgi:hypothetical protein
MAKVFSLRKDEKLRVTVREHTSLLLIITLKLRSQFLQRSIVDLSFLIKITKTFVVEKLLLFKHK